jgi:hypothetical protein
VRRLAGGQFRGGIGGAGPRGEPHPQDGYLARGQAVSGEPFITQAVELAAGVGEVMSGERRPSSMGYCWMG